MSRLIMVHGVCWGVGQSTLCRHLASALPRADVLWEDELSQPAIFTRPEFAAVADRFRRRNARPTEGIACPTAQLLEDAYESLLRTVLDQDYPTLMGWSVLDLAEDLDWARADEAALQRHSRVVREILGPLDPVLIYLDGDIRVAFERAASQRGRAWFTRGQPIDESQWPETRRRLLNEGSVAAARTRRAFVAGRWFPMLQISGTALDADEVFRRSARYLRQRGIDVAG